MADMIKTIILFLVAIPCVVILGLAFTSKPAEVEEPERIVEDLDFNEYYRTLKENKLVADDTYKGNWYRLSAQVEGLETGGLLNMTGGATLTLRRDVDGTIVFFLAEFEKEQEENLKTIKVGDEITFIGQGAGEGFIECELQ